MVSCCVSMVRSARNIHPLQVLNEPGRKATQKSYMWLFATGRGSPPIIVYNYQTTRASKHPVRFLTGFNGLLQIDGYQGYNKLPASIELAGCFAHVRRKYTDILKSLPKNTKTKDSLAEKAIKMKASSSMSRHSKIFMRPDKSIASRSVMNISTGAGKIKTKQAAVFSMP